MENSMRTISSDLELLTLGTTFDILFYIIHLACPGVTIKVTEGLGYTGVSRKNVIMSSFDVLMAGIGVYDDSSDGSDVSIGEPDVFGKKGYDFVLLQVFRVKNGGPGKSVGYRVMRAFDVRYFHTEVGKLYAPSSVSIREILGFFEELEADMVRIHINPVGRGD